MWKALTRYVSSVQKLNTCWAEGELYRYENCKVKREKLSAVPQRTGTRRHTVFWGERFKPQKGTVMLSMQCVLKLWNLLAVGQDWVQNGQMCIGGQPGGLMDQVVQSPSQRTSIALTVGTERACEEWSFTFFPSTSTVDHFKGRIQGWIAQCNCY